MKFYSGFSLKNEACFFTEYLDMSMYCVSGFSYGGLKAFEYTKAQISDGKRIDRLQLFSPAFFQTKQEKFKRLQELSYNKSKDKYLNQFLLGCFAPYSPEKIEQEETTSEQLHELLNYEWILSDLVALKSKGVVIEVYLGAEDKIIDVLGAQELFLEVATVTYIKNANHFLQIQEGKY